MQTSGLAEPAGGSGEESAFKAGMKVGAGRFALHKQLGSGGMGLVWLAADERLNEWVALKLLAPHIAQDPEVLLLMREETFKSRKLTHPNIIRIHDLFESPQETPFISMEYVDGRML